MKKRISGFTLIELLFAVAIVAILTAIAVPNYLEDQTRSKVSRVKSDMRHLSLAFEAYFVDRHQYPLTYEKYRDGPNVYGTLPLVRRIQQVTTPVAYLTTLPNDPFPHKDWENAPGNQTYIYCRGDARPEVWQAKEWVGPDCWLLNSAGPDQNIESISYWTPVEIYSSGLSGFVRRYDPSNGTLSPGDIFLWGPGDRAND